MNEHGTDTSSGNGAREEAELRKLESETARNEAERLKFESENLEIRRRLNQRWRDIRLGTLLQALIAGLVGGALLWGFALDHFLKVSELNDKTQQAIEKENQEMKKRQLALEDVFRDMTKNNNELKNQIEDQKNRKSAELNSYKEKLKELEQRQVIPDVEKEQLAAEKTETQQQITALQKDLTILQSASVDAKIRSKNIARQQADKYTVLVFYRKQQEFQAKKIVNTLISAEYQSSSFATNFSELREPHPPGTIYISYTDRGKEIIEGLKEELESLGLEGSLKIPPKTFQLRRGDVQIMLF